MSTRRSFRRGDDDWDEFAVPRGFSKLSELRSIDGQVNDGPEGTSDIDCTPETLDACIEQLPRPRSDSEYYLLAVNLDGELADFVPGGWNLLGHDLTDSTYTSSLLNCGPWTGQLQPIAERMNDVGLLSHADARAAQALLPSEWGEGMDHTQVVVWALYERR